MTIAFCLFDNVNFLPFFHTATVSGLPYNQELKAEWIFFCQRRHDDCKASGIYHSLGSTSGTGAQLTHTFMITVETIANYHRWSLVPRSPNVWDWSNILIWQERRISGENLPHLVSIREGGSGESCGFERLKVFWSLKLIVILNMKYG